MQAQAILQLVLMLMLFIPLIYWVRMKKYNSEIRDLIDVDDSEISVSVILPMRNEEVNVGRKLSTIIDEINDYDNVELIIADSNSDDDTYILANEFLKKSDLDNSKWKIINFEIPGKNLALNGVLKTINSEERTLSSFVYNLQI